MPTKMPSAVKNNARSASATECVADVLPCARHSDFVSTENSNRADLISDRLAASLRGLGPIGIIAVLIVLGGNLIFVPLSAVLVLIWAWISNTPWHRIGYVRPESWTRTIVIGTAFGVAFKLLMKSGVMPLLGAPPINQAFHYLVGNKSALPGILYMVLIGAAFGEETIFRGYAFERLSKLLGEGSRAKVVIVGITAGWFGWEHYFFQGIPGVQQATIVGLVFGAIFALTGRLWLLIVAHAAFDLTAVAIIYWDLETKVAHLFFK